MKKILVPIDFSPASRNACAYAASLAKAFSAELSLLHVFMEPVPATEAPVAWIITGSELQEMNDGLVQEEVRLLKNNYHIEVNGTAKVGYKGDTIHDTAKKLKTDLIVMGMKEGKKNKIIGSTALTTIRKVEIPVLIVPEKASFAPIKHVVLASDFDMITNVSCFNPLFKIVQKFDASVQVFHVRKKGVEIPASEIPGKIQLGRAFSKVSFLYQDVEDEHVEHGILSFIQSHPSDLLVMVAHHHNIFERIFGTVHTRSISFEAKLPLLVLADK